MSKNALPCIVCGHELLNVEQTADNQPYGGTAFESHGHYGSTAFDPMGGDGFLELNICDVCLVRAALRGAVLHATKKREKIVLKYVPWKPELDGDLENVEQVAEKIGTLGMGEKLVP